MSQTLPHAGPITRRAAVYVTPPLGVSNLLVIDCGRIRGGNPDDLRLRDSSGKVVTQDPSPPRAPTDQAITGPRPHSYGFCTENLAGTCLWPAVDCRSSTAGFPKGHWCGTRTNTWRLVRAPSPAQLLCIELNGLVAAPQYSKKRILVLRPLSLSLLRGATWKSLSNALAATAIEWPEAPCTGGG